MSNVCRHRMSTLLEGRGNTRSIICPYHAWTYNLDGSLRGAPAMTLNESFCKSDIALPLCAARNGWAGSWSRSTPMRRPLPSGCRVSRDLVGKFHMENYVEAFREEFRWNTNWKVLAENFMESYHLPVCHAGTIGGHVDLLKMTCPEGLPAFNYHYIIKNDALDLTLAHPTNTTLQGDERRTTWLISVYPSLLITLSPGYFWYLCLTPDGPDHVNVLYGGGLAPEFVADPKAQEHFDRAEGAARRGEHGRQGLRRTRLSRPVRRSFRARPAQPSGAAELRLRPLHRRNDARPRAPRSSSVSKYPGVRASAPVPPAQPSRHLGDIPEQISRKVHNGPYPHPQVQHQGHLSRAEARQRPLPGRRRARHDDLSARPVPAGPRHGKEHRQPRSRWSRRTR